MRAKLVLLAAEGLARPTLAPTGQPRLPSKRFEDRWPEIYFSAIRRKAWTPDDGASLEMAQDRILRLHPPAISGLLVPSSRS